MKTLLEQVINELKISKASTGRKLDTKNFSDLKKGDLIYTYNIKQDRLWIAEFDKMNKSNGFMNAITIGKINNFKASNFTSKEEPMDIPNVSQPRYIPKSIDIPVFFSQEFRLSGWNINFIVATSIDIIKKLVSNDEEFDNEVEKGNITK